MLNGKEKHLLSGRFSDKAMQVKAMAKSGKDYDCALYDAMLMKVELCTVDDTVSQGVQSTRIFENIFE